MFRRCSYGALLAVLGVAVCLHAIDAKAANYYFDVNGASANSGATGAGPYSWEGTNWTTDLNGSSPTVAYLDGNFPRFSAGTDAVGSYTVTANANHTTVGMFVEDQAINSTLTINGTGTIGIDGGVQQGFFVRGSDNLKIFNSIVGTGGINFQTSGGTGSGSLYLYGSNTFTAGVTLTTSGGLNFNNDNSFGTGRITWGTSTVVLADPDVTSAITLPNAMTTRNASTLILAAAGPVTFNGAWTMPAGTSATHTTATLLVGNTPFPSTNITVKGAIGGAFADLIVNGQLVSGGPAGTTGTLFLTGTNTYTGATIINAAGTGGSTTLSLGNGGTTGKLAAAGTIIDNSIFAINRSNAVSQGTDFSSSAITGTGSLIKTGVGTATLNAANAYSGGTTLDNGGLALGNKSAVGTGNLTIGGTTTSPSISLSSTTNLTGANAVANPVTVMKNFTVASGSSDLELSGGVSLGAANRTITVDSSNATILSGVVADTGGTGGLTKVGGGVMTLSGPNTYGTAGVTGTTVNAGKLLVNNTTGSGTGAGNVLVASGATLGGNGSLTGAVTVNGTYSPGASIGKMTTGALSFGLASTFTYELNSSLPFPYASSADLANAAGALTIDPTTFLNISDPVSTKLPLGTKFTLISYSGNWVQPPGHPQPNHFAGLPNGSSFTLGQNQWNIRYDDPTGGSNFGGGAFLNHVTITAVPEASTFIVIGLGGIFTFAAVWMGKRMGVNVLKT